MNTIGVGLAVTIAEPVMVAVQDEATCVATTVYVPLAGWLPKEIAAPVPGTTAPTGFIP